MTRSIAPASSNDLLAVDLAAGHLQTPVHGLPRRLAWSMAVLALYWAVGLAVLAVVPLDREIVGPWISPALGLAALLLLGPWIAPAIFVACVVVDLLAGAPAVAQALVSAATDTAHALLSWWLVARVARVDLRFSRVQDVGRFVVAGPLALAVFVALSMLAAGLFGGTWPGTLAEVLLPALSAGVGSLVITPAIVVVVATPREHLSRGNVPEGILLALTLIGTALLVFRTNLVPEPYGTQLPYLLFPVTFWAGARYGPRETAVAILGASAIAILCTASGSGPFAAPHIPDGLAGVYLFTFALAATGLLFAAGLRQRSLADRKARTADQRLAQLIGHMNEGVILLGSDGRITWASDRFCELAGRSRAEIVDRPFEQLLPPEARTAWRQLGSPTGFDDRSVDDTTFARPDGTTVEVQLSMRPLPAGDDASASAGTFAVVTDITPRRRAEEQARAHLQQLAHVARVSSLGEMASAIAHEINQPLTAIANYADACVRLLDREDASREDLRAAMTRVAAQAQRAGDIVRKMRGFVRGDEADVGPVAARFLLEEVRRLALPEARERDVPLEIDTRSDVGEVIADSIQIQQVLLNLVRNAIEAVAGCGDAVRLVRASALRTGDDAIEFRVDDSGPGVPEDVRDRIFEAFFTTKAEGMGIGLALSRSIVEAHGGELLVEDAPGGGARFRVILPAIPEDIAERR